MKCPYCGNDGMYNNNGTYSCQECSVSIPEDVVGKLEFNILDGFYDEDNIRPCPYCGDTDVIPDGVSVECEYCGLSTPVCDGTYEAIRIWNGIRIRRNFYGK